MQNIWSAVRFWFGSESQGPPANQHARSGSGLGEKELLNFSSTSTVATKIQRKEDQLLCVKKLGWTWWRKQAMWESYWLDTLHRGGLGVMCGCLVEGGGGCLGSQPDRRL